MNNRKGYTVHPWWKYLTKEERDEYIREAIDSLTNNEEDI